LLTTRTTRGLARARRELGDQVIARVAPLDLPQLLRSFLKASAPWRLDIIETEIWPHLILESRRHNVAVVFVSATVTDRTTGRLRRWGFSGRGLFGEGVWVLAQSERHAERFCSLGVPPARIAVTGDLKAEPPTGGASRDAAARRAVVFGSVRPGEEALALALARNLARGGARALVAAPRHRDGLERLVAAFERAGVPVSLRREEERQRESLPEWIAGLSAAGPQRVGLLAGNVDGALAGERHVVEVEHLVVEGLQRALRERDQAHRDIERGQPRGGLHQVAQMLEIDLDVLAPADAADGGDQTDGGVGLDHAISFSTGPGF
jgi:hypothetical protein